MVAYGYITHAAHNRRWTIWLILGYIAAFEVIGAFASTMILLLADHEHTILSDPLGYAIRYAVPIAAFAGFIFWWMYRGHAKAVTHALGVRIVSRQDEPRFFQIAEEQCTALGVRLPRFGILESNELNAVTVGEGPNRGLIAITRGLLDQLDDDELAAVLAHEASHIRHGDTKLLAANHALMRTAVIMQMNNPLRLEDWRQIILPIVFPPMLLILLAGSAASMMSIRLSRAARRGLKLSRDYIADGEAIRVTHFPEALISAISKIAGHGAFQGSQRVDGMLFDGRADHEGGSQPTARDRIEVITALAGELMNPARQRRDSRIALQAAFGRRGHAAAFGTSYNAPGTPLEKPAPASAGMLLLFLTDNAAFWKWHNASVAWEEQRLNERRNLIGVAPKMMLPIGAMCAVLLVMYWPKDGNFANSLARFNPSEMVDLARMTHSGPFCVGPSYPDGKCAGANSVPNAVAAKAAHGHGLIDLNRPAGKFQDPAEESIIGFVLMRGMPIFLMIAFVLAIFKPKRLLWPFAGFGGGARATVKSEIAKDDFDEDAGRRADRLIQEQLNELRRGQFKAAPRSAAGGFGRRGV